MASYEHIIVFKKDIKAGDVILVHPGIWYDQAIVYLMGSSSKDQQLMFLERRLPKEHERVIATVTLEDYKEAVKE